MKRFTLALFAVLCGALSSHAQTFTVDTILNNGDRANRINLVFLGDGYTAGEQTQYIADVNAILDKFFQCSPLSEYKPFFNVYAVRVVSAQSGAKHPNSASDCSTASPAVPTMSPNTYFGATFDYGGTHRLLYCPGTAAINTVLQTNTPWYDKALIVVNTPYYGGSGGNYSIGSVHPSSAEIMIHEFGHSFAGLADEYGGSYCNGLEKPNVTQETNPNLIKWKNWINPGTPIPTPAFTNCGNEGLYNGGNYCTNGWYRPRCDCKMRTLNQPLCAVCKQEFILKIHQSVSLIDSHLPSSAAPVNMAANGTQVFSAQVLNNIPNTIKTQWKLNGTVVATNVENYTLNAASLAVGSHTLSITASDTTAMSRTVLPTSTVTWNIVIGSGGSTVTLQPFNPVCSNGNAVTLSGGAPAGGTYSGPGVTGNTFNPAVAGTGSHNITYTHSGQSATQVLTVNATPVLSGPTTASVCNGSTATLAVGGGTTYSWSPATGLSVTTGGSVVTSATTNITYTVTGTTNGCTATKAIAVTVNALPNVTTSGTATVCNGSSTSLTAARATTYSWSPATGLNTTSAATVVANPTVSTTYSLTGTANGCSKTISVPVTVGATPVLTGTASATVCAGSAANLSVNGATFYAWSPSTALNTTSGAAVSASPTNPITYTVTGTTNGCSSTKTIAVSVTALPNVTAPAPQNICAGSAAALTASGATAYSWSPNTNLSSSNGASVSATPTSSVTYTVTGTANGCSNTALVPVIVTPLPNVVINTSSPSVCPGNPATLTAGGATSYTWTPSASLSATNGASVTASPTLNTTYTVTGTTNGCAATATVTIQMGTGPALTASPNTMVCNGGSATLTVSGASAYAWSPSTGLSATTGGTVTASPMAPTTYTITGTQGGCTSTQTIAVGVTSGPTLTGSADQTICSNASAALTAGGANTYTWAPATGLNATAGSNVIATPASTTTYTVTGFVSGCSAVKTVVVNVTQAPTVTAPANTNVCEGFMTNLIASGASSFTWSPAVGLNTTLGSSVNANPASTTTYTVTGAQNGCTATAIAVVTVNPLPDLTAVSGVVACEGGSVNLSATGADVYAWSPSTALNNTTGATVSASPSGNITYTVTGTTNGCNAQQTIEVTVSAGPTLGLVSTNPPCDGTASGSIALTVSGGTADAFAWSNGATTQNLDNLQAGLYTVTVSAGGCTTTAEAELEADGCAAPTTSQAGVVTSSQATLHWNTVPCAVSYEVRRRLVGASNWDYFQVADTFKKFYNLLANTAYEYQVRSWCDAQQTQASAFSPSFYFTTGMTCLTPAVITAVNIAGTSATLSWSPVVNATGFKVRYRKNGGASQWNETLLPATQTSLDISGLLNATTYKYQVRTLCDPVAGEVSNYSISKFFTTLPMRGEQTESANEMTVYPNPAENNVLVEATFDTDGPYEIDVLDMTGRVLHRDADHTNRGALLHELDLTGYAEGMYCIRIVRGSDVLVRKLIKR